MKHPKIISLALSVLIVSWSLTAPFAGPRRPQAIIFSRNMCSAERAAGITWLLTAGHASSM